MNRSFYDNEKTDFIYPEIGICMEDTTDRTAKIFIPIATPTLPRNGLYDNKEPVTPLDNIVSSTTSMDIFGCTISNYITMNLPKEIDSLHADDKVVLVFIGGDINKPVIIGRYQ